MNITLVKAGLEDAKVLYDMQIESFMPLLAKYQDFETSPANEPIEKIINRINQSFTDYYIIKKDSINVGGIRIIKGSNNINSVGPLFILSEYQGKGIAQKVFRMIEQKYKDAKKWELHTILQESGNCYLYEKLGYKKTGENEIINNLLTLVLYEKFLN